MDGTATQLTFIASGTGATATFTPSTAGQRGLSITHQNGVRRVAFGRIATGSGAATLQGTFTETLATGADGLADALHLDVAVNVVTGGNVTAYGALTAPDGIVIGAAETRANLTVGSRSIRLSFPGSVIYGSGANGPYHLTDLTLFGQNGADVEARLAATGPTRSYLASVFRPAVIAPEFAPATAEGNTGTTEVQIQMRLANRVNRAVTVHYAPFTQPGWATFPDDFDAPAGTLTFQPGETTKTIPLTIKGDVLDETDEGALIALTQPTNAAIGGFGVGGVTITDDDTPPVP